MDHELDVTFNASNLVGWDLIESSSYFVVSSSNYVQNKLVHYLLRTIENCISLDLLNYFSESLHVGWHLFFFKLGLSLVEDLLLLNADTFLLTSFFVYYFLFATTGLLIAALGAPSSSSTIHVNFRLYLLVHNEGSSPLMMITTPHNYFVMGASTLRHLDYLEMAIESVALSLDSSVNFDAVVTNFKLIVQVPKLSVAAWTFNLLLLFSTTYINLGGNFNHL